jgi:hypothetical protein
MAYDARNHQRNQLSGSAQCQPHNLGVRLPHLVGHHVAIDVHRPSDVAVPHQLLLNSDWRPDGIQPSTVGVPKGVSAEMPDSRFFGRPLKFAPKPRVRIGKAAQLQRAVQTALEILATHPAGLRFSSLVERLYELLPHESENTIRTYTWKLAAWRPQEVCKPARGIFRLARFRETEATDVEMNRIAT